MDMARQKLRLVALRAEEPNVCVAEFEGALDGQRIVSRVRIEDEDGIVTAVPDPDPFVEFEGTADDVRRIVRVMIDFCRVSSRKYRPRG